MGDDDYGIHTETDSDDAMKIASIPQRLKDAGLDEKAKAAVNILEGCC